MAKQGGARLDRRAAFLRALAKTGSVRAAARAVGTWPGTAYDWRKRDPAFGEAWARALAEARAALAAGAAPVLGDAQVVRGSRHGRPCVARVGAKRWSAGREARFLAVLAETCSVRDAARAAGFSTTALYVRRARWPDFDARWREALGHGWRRLELSLLRAANARFPDGEEEAGGASLPAAREGAGGGGGGEAMAFAAPMTVDQALILYKIHRHGATGEGARPRHDWRRREMSIEEVRAEVLRRVRALGG